MERVNFPLKQDKIRTLVSTLTSKEIASHLNIQCFVEEALLYAFDDNHQIQISRKRTRFGDIFEVETAFGESHFHYRGHAFKEIDDEAETRYVFYSDSAWIERGDFGSPRFEKGRSAESIYDDFAAVVTLIESGHISDSDFEARR